MIEIIASNNERFPVGIFCGVRTAMGGLSATPATFFAMVKTFSHISVDFNSLAVEVLDEEKSKSFLGAASVGLVGAALLGPLGLIAGALAGGNKQLGVFGLSFDFEGHNIKLVVKTSSKSEIRYFKDRSFVNKASA